MWNMRPSPSKVSRDALGITRILAHHPFLRILVHFVFTRIDLVTPDQVVELKRFAKDLGLVVGVFHRRGLATQTADEDVEVAHLGRRLLPDRDAVLRLV